MESIPEFENLLLKPKEKNEKVSTLLYKPEETNLAPVKYSNTSAEPTREDFVSDASYQEYLNQKAKNDPRRYVGEKPTDIHVAPGKDHSVIYRLPSGIEVIYTRKKVRDKNGEYWAEVDFNGQRGWVVANDLRVTNPNTQKTTTVSLKDETENTPVTSSGATNSAEQTQGTQEQEKPKQETRKVSDGPLNMRSEPGMKTEVIEKLPKGTEVIYTGKITEEKDGHVWAEVAYDGKTGWVAVEYLEEITEKEPEDEKEGEIRIPHRMPTMYDLYFSPDKDKNGEFYFRPVITANSNVSGYKEEDETPPLKIDENVPEGLIVEKQKMNAKDRTEYLNEQIPEWLAEDMDRTDAASDTLVNWFKQQGATARYTGPYCLPINPKSLAKISQGFYGKTSHAGSVESWYEEGFGKCGAVDLAIYYSDKDIPIYSVLPGKVVCVDSDGKDFHRVTVETQINGETYYLEYLHSAKIMTQKGEEVTMGTQIGTVGGWGTSGNTDFPLHLDFRVYQFKDGEQDSFSSDSAKHFIDPFELFDFDVQYNYNLGKHDYH